MIPWKRIATAAFCISAVGLLTFCLTVFNPVSVECMRPADKLRLPLRSQELASHSTAEFPKNLRTDLRGETITIALPENAPDRRWDDELLAEFHGLTGIQVEAIRPGNDTTAVLSRYLEDLRSESPKADVYAIDIVWPGILAEFAEDLRPAFEDLHDVAPELIRNDTVNGKLIAVPYFTEVSLLYYRTDLLRKYHIVNPPRTWSELASQAGIIENRERAGGNGGFWGYIWQGAASEALTCNAFEWQMSQGGGHLLASDGALSLEPAQTAKAWDRARRWIGTISPPDTTDHFEDDSLHIWTSGNAAFMRNWPYAWRESARDDSRVRGNVAVTVMPRGEAQAGRHADVLGGFQLMVSNRSRHRDASIELVRFLTSPEVQRFNAIRRGYLPTLPDLYGDPALLKANPFFASLRDVLVHGAVARPSSLAGERYDTLSRAYFTAAHQTLTGEKPASIAVADLRKDLKHILAN